VLVPGCRAVVTGWEALDPHDERIPARHRQASLAFGAVGSGLTAVEVVERPAWHERERARSEEDRRA
jgi:hypothetical protein